MKRFHGLWILLSLVAISACQSHPAADRAAEASTRDATTLSGSHTQPAAAATRPTVRTDASRAAASIPAYFSEYASEPFSTGQRCVVGATTDNDGMNQRPVAYVVGAKGKQLVWVDKLMLPPNTFQSRATHCTSSDHSLFVLLQSDTQSEQTLSQTLLRVVKIDPATGSVQMQQNIELHGALSIWVDEGPSHFQWKGNALIVSGNERLQSSPDQPTTFTIRMDADLKPSCENNP